MPPTAGTTENVAAVTPPAGTTISSGTASEAMIKAATAASSAAPEVTPPAGAGAGDTTLPAGSGTPGATAAATAQPRAAGQPAAEGKGPVPFDRHEAAVRNAREAEAAKFAWAKDLNPQDVQNAISLHQEMRRDLRGFVERTIQEANLPIGQPPKETKPAWKMPDPALRSEDGKGAYTSEQMLDIIEHVKEELRGEIQPLRDFRDTTVQSQTMAQRLEAGRERINSALAQARELPHFKEHEAAIAAKVKAIDPQTRAQIGVVGCLHMAYNAVLAETVFPSINATAEQKVREENERKAATSTGSVRPSGATGAGGQPPKLENVSDLAKHMERMAAAG